MDPEDPRALSDGALLENAMVYANTIVIATLGVILASSKSAQLGPLRAGLAILGLVLCISWGLLTVRSFDYHKHWVLSSRELEALLPPVRTVSGGGLLAGDSKNTMTYRFTPAITHRMRRVGQFRIELVSYAIIAVFSLIYLGALAGGRLFQ